MAPLSSLVPILSFLAPLISAHGHVTGIVVDGKWNRGWDAELKYQNPIPLVAGWQADNLDNGFITPSQFATSDIICHKSAKNANAYVEAKAGSKVTFVWNTWPVSHKGKSTSNSSVPFLVDIPYLLFPTSLPISCSNERHLHKSIYSKGSQSMLTSIPSQGPVIDYIAPCNGDCTTITKESLRFTKFAQGAWISGNDPGTWVTDDLVKANNSWTTTIPATLAPGNYVIRHEIIALHAAGQTNGAQAYPQCVNFKITGDGTQTLGSSGTAATAFYKAADPGILFNLYSKFTGYTIPGPAIASLKKREAEAEGETRTHARNWV